jgi:hypothetical protein
MRRVIRSSVVAALAVSAAAVAAPSVTAAPPEDVTLTDYFLIFADLNVNRSVFVNITAVDLCEWAAGGFVGPPPVVDDDIAAVANLTGKGALVGHGEFEDLHIELWEFDDEPPALLGPCEDIAEQLEAGTGPWATGSADVRVKTNDFFGSGTRTAAFGDRTTAIVTDEDGNDHAYRNVFRLNSSCHSGLSAPPSCLVDHSQLRML